MTLDALLLILSVNADFQALVPDRPSGSWDGHLGANRVHCESEKPIKRFQNTVNGSHSSTNVDFRSGGTLKPRRVKLEIDRREGGRKVPPLPILDPSHGRVPAQGLICSACRRPAARRIIALINEDGFQCSRSLAACVEGEMSDKIYDVPAEWTKRAWIDQAKYQEM